MPLCTLVLLFQCMSRVSSSLQDRYPIFVSHISSDNDFSGARLAVELAFEHVNANSNLLSGYTLNATNYSETACDRTGSLKDFVTWTRSGNQTQIGSLCCGCSTATEAVGEISSLWNIAQISYTYGSGVLNDKNTYKRLFQTFPSSDYFPLAILSLMKFFTWSRVVFVTENESPFLQIFNRFQMLYGNVAATLNTLLPCDMEDLVRNITQNGFKIVVLNCYSQSAKMVLCEAAKNKMFYREYVWILHGWYPDNWWMFGGQSNCSNDQMMEVLNLSLVIKQQPVPANMYAVAIGGYSSQKLLELYNGSLYNTNYSFSPTWAAAYDAVWALAIAFNKTIFQLALNNFNLSQNAIQAPIASYYFDTNVSCLLLQTLRDTQFYGASGEVSFKDDGSRNYSLISVAQIRILSSNIEEATIGLLNTADGSYIANVTIKSVYPNGAPTDRFIHTYASGLSEAFYTLAIVGLLFTLVCAVFNFSFRNKRVIQLSSPNLNYFILVGAILGCISIINGFIRVDTAQSCKVQCILNDWLTILGYSLAINTILAKMWRINYICNNPSPNKLLPKDWHLAIIVAMATGLLAILLLLKATIPPLQYTPTLKNDLSSKQIQFFYACYENQSSSYYGTVMMYACYAVVQTVGLYLVYKSKNVTSIPSLNDTKSVTALIYISTVCFCVIAILKFILDGYSDLSNTLSSLMSLVLIASFLGLVFGPKIVALYKDPSGEVAFNTQSVSANPTNTLSRQFGEQSPAYVTGLETRVRELEMKLKQISENENTQEVLNT